MLRYSMLLFVAGCTFGAARVTRPPSGPAGDPAPQSVTFVDRAPHQAGFVKHDGVRLHYLEWPGPGPTIVLLPGFSLTAHVFDEVATTLAENHRVIAITPRGFGESDAPDSSAYTIATLVSDLRVVLDSLYIRQVTLVGHSLAGSVIARFGTQYPKRVDRLIFLDAFPYFAAEGGDSIGALNPVQPPPFVGDSTYAAIATYLGKYWYAPWRPSLDADLRAKDLGPESARRRRLTLGYIRDQRAKPPNLSALRVPTLQLCAVASVGSEYPWLSRSSAEFEGAAQYVENTLRPFQRRLCERFAKTVPKARAESVLGSHYIFFTQPTLTVGAIRSFLK